MNSYVSRVFFKVFSYTADKEIRTDDLCLDVSRLNGPVVMLKCHHMKGNQMFEYDAEVGSMFPAVTKDSKRRPGGLVPEKSEFCVSVCVCHEKIA